MGHLAASTKSQYIVARLMSSGNLRDSKAAIPLLKKVAKLVPDHFTTAIFDASYDYEPIYRQALDQTIHVVIPNNVRREVELLGFGEHFRPTCVREYSYCYGSFDEKYRTLKFTRLKEYETCPLRKIRSVKRYSKLSAKRILASIRTQHDVQNTGKTLNESIS